MKDFTKIKLINSLIDVVDRFYELKNENDLENSAHLKGFCEGMAFSMIELKFITQDEAKKILSGLGKKLDENDVSIDEIPESEEMQESIKVEVQKPTVDDLSLDIEIDDIHPKNPIFTPQKKLNDLDIPTYLRKKRD